MDGCIWLDETTQNELAGSINDFFLANVKDVRKYEIERGYACKDYIVIPIDACVGNMPLSLTWAVYINKDGYNLWQPE